MKICSIPGCKNKYSCKGWCSTHYKNYRRSGNPLGKRNGKKGEEYDANGYKIIRIDGVSHRVHVLIVERILERKLPSHVEVHHVNGNRSDNRNENLVVCDSHAYHFLLHRRQRALDACGNPSYRKCNYCKQWCPESELKTDKNCSVFHPKCKSMDTRKRIAKKGTQPNE